MAVINDIVPPSRISVAETEWKTTKKIWPNGRTTAKRMWASPLHHFEVEWDGITLAEYQALRDHFNAHAGSYGVFQLVDTHEGVTYNVRFEDDSFKRQMVRPNSRGLYKLKLKFVEDKS